MYKKKIRVKERNLNKQKRANTGETTGTLMVNN